MRSSLLVVVSAASAGKPTLVTTGPRASLRMPVRGVAATSDAAIRADAARSLTSAVRSAGENAGRGTRMSTLRWRPHSQARHRHRWRHRHKRRGEADARAGTTDGDGGVELERGRGRGRHRGPSRCCEADAVPESRRGGLAVRARAAQARMRRAAMRGGGTAKEEGAGPSPKRGTGADGRGSVAAMRRAVRS